MAAGGSSKAVLAAMAANGGIAVAKFIGFALTRSSSMLAEAIHSVADTSNQALLLFGGKQAVKRADDEHQFGYHRERYFWSFVVALVLFGLGGGFAIYEGILKIIEPHKVDRVGIALGILAFGILLEGWSFRTAIREARPLRKGQTWWQFIRRTRHPELAVVLLEDLGAQIGLIIAFIAVGSSHYFEMPIFDGIGTLIIGLLLLGIAMILIIEMRSLLIGEGAQKGEMQKIRDAINSSPSVNKIIHLRTQHLGPEALLVGAKVVFDQSLEMAEVAAAINDVETRVRAVVPHARPMFVEPGLPVDPRQTLPQ